MHVHTPSTVSPDRGLNQLHLIYNNVRVLPERSCPAKHSQHPPPPSMQHCWLDYISDPAWILEKRFTHTHKDTSCIAFSSHSPKFRGRSGHTHAKQAPKHMDILPVSVTTYALNQNQRNGIFFAEFEISTSQHLTVLHIIKNADTRPHQNQARRGSKSNPPSITDDVLRDGVVRCNLEWPLVGIHPHAGADTANTSHRQPSYPPTQDPILRIRPIKRRTLPDPLEGAARAASPLRPASGYHLPNEWLAPPARAASAINHHLQIPPLPKQQRGWSVWGWSVTIMG